MGADLPGSWLNDTTFSTSFDVSDVDIDIDAVSVDVEGASDVAGNPMTDYTAENEAGIDTLNPEEPLLVITDNDTTDSDAGPLIYSAEDVAEAAADTGVVLSSKRGWYTCCSLLRS